MMRTVQRIAAALAIVLISALVIVQYRPDAGLATAEPVPGAASKAGPGTPLPVPANLPAPLVDMRDAILAATHTGRLDDLKVPIEWNELRPDFGQKAGEDPFAALKAAANDDKGHANLAILANVLELPPAAIRAGRDVENNAVFVWPYLAEADLAKLTDAQRVELYRLMSPAEAKAILDGKKWTWWRLVLGADGTWHAFKKQ